MKKPQLALIGFIGAFAIVHALVAAWTPIVGEDWNDWIWAGRHPDAGIGAILASHITFSDLIGYVLSRSTSFHTLVTPMTHIALVVGLFTIAMKRTPGASWLDVLGIVLTSALLWLAQPSAGLSFFIRSNAALTIYGSAVAVWFFAPFWCSWKVPRWALPLLAIGGYCTGTSTRAIATATLVGVVYVMRTRREKWMTVPAAALVIGTFVGYFVAPRFELMRIVRRGFEQNLVGPGLVKFMVEEGGEIVSLVLLLVLANYVLGMFGKPNADVEKRPDAKSSLGWFAAWWGTAIWCLFGPKYNEPLLVPASCMLVIGALPALLWLAEAKWLRVFMIVVAVGVHVIVWPLALSKYSAYGAEGRVRMATLEHTKKGETAFIHPTKQIPADFWFPGETLAIARQRQLVAIEAFGIRDIEFLEDFRRLDPNPEMKITLFVDGVSDADLKAAQVPPFLASEIGAARKQFELFVKRLQAVTGKMPSARLAVELPGWIDKRPLLAAWTDDGMMIPRTSRTSVDPDANITVRMYPPESRQFTEAYVIESDKATQIQYHGGSPTFRPTSMGLDLVIACNKTRCIVVDAFIPRF